MEMVPVEGDTLMINPDLATVGTRPPVSERSLELRGENGVITVTVRPFARSRVTFARRVKGVVLRILNRVAPDRTGRLQPAELPTQFIVLSHYLQARRGLPSDQALADAIGVPRAEVVLWTAGQVPGDEKMRRLRDLATIVARLAEYYEPAAIPDWLYGQNPDLGGRQPIELLHEGNLADVLSAAEAQISGAYI